MAVPLTGCAKITMIAFIIMNLIFLALGITVIGIGAYFVSEGNDYEFLAGGTFASPGALLIVVGCITFIVTAIGILGAACKSQILLIIYILCLLVVIILEIVAAIIAFVFREDIADEVGERMVNAVERYLPETDPNRERDVNSAVDFVQSNFDCCGANNASDWPTLNPNFFCGNVNQPPSDCACDFGVPGCALFMGSANCSGTITPYNFTAWEPGCINDTRDALERLGYIVGGVGIAFGVIQILGVLMALGLCMCIRSSRKQEVV